MVGHRDLGGLAHDVVRRTIFWWLLSGAVGRSRYDGGYNRVAAALGPASHVAIAWPDYWLRVGSAGEQKPQSGYELLHFKILVND